MDESRVIWHARNLVRESGYNICMLKAESTSLGVEYSRAFGLYEEACSLLRLVDEEAETFINSSWKP
jgi:hypothetical protein